MWLLDDFFRCAYTKTYQTFNLMSQLLVTTAKLTFVSNRDMGLHCFILNVSTAATITAR